MTDRLRDDPLALVGKWTFSRTIDDRLTGLQSSVLGKTELTAENDHDIRWSESGTLFLGDQQLPVSRVLHIVVRDGTWVVTFEDGRYFHPWDPGAYVEHPCGADLYAGRIDVEPDRWTVEWHVSGPHKDYVMTTELRAH